MYKLHLILKYLRKRRIAWVSLIAVMLCTTMVLVVISIMGGWLRMFRASFQGLSGEVIVSARHMAGFPYYEEMAAEIEKLPEVGPGGVVPVIRTFGLINIGDRKNRAVQVFGYPISRIGVVNDFPRSLWRQHVRYVEALDKGALTDTERIALGLLPQQDGISPLIWPEGEIGPDEVATPLTAEERRILQQKADEGLKNPSFDKPLPDEIYKSITRVRNPRATESFIESAPEAPGMIAGVGVLEIRKNQEGQLIGREQFKYMLPVKLTVLGIDPGAVGIDIKGGMRERPYWLVDDSRTQVWQYDSESVYVPFEVLQQDLRMQPVPEATTEDGRPDPVPGRTTELHVNVLPGHNLDAVRDKVMQIVADVYIAEHEKRGRLPGELPMVETWEETQAVFIDAIEKEKLLVTFLFGIISIVAIFMIFCIFYMIVVEKTRDIGIIKSVGASSRGVAGIFLGYGLAIGIVGAGLGLLASYLIVHNINELHTWLGRAMGIQIWNPEVYAFDTIPNTMNPWEVVTIVGIAVVASVIGSLVPAIRAARMHPIEALRYE